jgi:hypothetical protein
VGWLAPVFLAVGAIALAIPVLVHLIHRERNETVPFPSLMFLQRIPYRSMRRQKIRNWLLFALRCLGLILLAAAFARPFFERNSGLAGGGAGGRELVILLDQSYSMGYGDRWQRAVAAARRAIDGMTGSDRASVVLFADDARALQQPTQDRASLRTAVDTARVTSRGTKFGPALKVARSILEQSRLPRREVVLITDFQKLGWNADEGTRLPDGTTLTRVDLSSAPTPDLAVAGVSFQRDFPQGRERVLVSARVTNRSTEPARRVAVSIDLNGRELQSRTADVGPNSATSVAFTPFMLPEGTSRGTVRMAPDALPADNRFHFALTQGQAVSVLIVEAAGGADRSLYLRRALGVGDQPAFRAETRRINQLTRADLAGRSVVVIDDAGIPSSGAAQLLQEFVAGGGGLLVALGDRSTASAFVPETRGFLPAAAGNVVDRSTASGGKLTRIDYSHPVFDLFATPRSGDLSSARFFRYRKLEVRDATGSQTIGQPAPSGAKAPSTQSASVLASFDDGSPALVEGRHGKGRVLVWASTLDNYWSDVAVKAVFLPFVHQLLKHAAAYAEATPWFTVGQSVDVNSGAVGGSDADSGIREDLVALAPSGARTVLPAGTGARVLHVTEQGFYEVRRPGATTPYRVIAGNLDLAESDLTPLDPAELAASVEPQGGNTTAAAGGTPQLAPADRERPQSIWWYLLIAAFVILAAETVVGNQLSRGAAP